MRHPTQNGRRVSHFAVLRQLGHGDLTRIYLATPRNRPTELVVLELLQTELAEDDDFRALFLDQAATTLALRHPNVVATHEVFADPEACGLTLEFLDGQTLARVLEHVGRQRFPVDLHLHILSKVLHALEHAHALGGLNAAEPLSLHRDVCPSNVFLTYDGGIKLLGTGFADVTRALEGRLGRPLVDVRYAAPEVLLGQPAGPSADLFGVGTMLWEALTRQSRSSADAALTIRKRTSGREPDLESAWADAPLPLVEVCARALALSPSERYSSAKALRTDLDAYLGRAAEPSEAVLGRLPELMQSWFGAERAQMQRFISTSIELAQRNPESMVLPAVEDELEAGDEEWTAQMGTGIARDGSVDVAGSAPSSTPLGNPFLEAMHPQEQQLQALRLDELEQPTNARSSSSTPAHPHSTAGSALPGPVDPAPARESTTGGHRAYSSNLDSPPARRSALRLGPDVLGAIALLLGSLVATYSLYRHSTRDKRPESQQRAAQAAPHLAPALEPVAPVRSELALAPAVPASSPAPVTRPVPASHPVSSGPVSSGPLPSTGPVASNGSTFVAARPSPRAATVTSDAGASATRRATTPAFFDGEAATSRHALEATPALSADELPRVDAELSSLQDAILTSARAKRAAKARRSREKKAESLLSSGSSPDLVEPRQASDVDRDVERSIE